MFLAIELLRAVECMHACDVVHGNVVLSNILVRNDVSGDETVAQAAWTQSGAQGWSNKGIVYALLPAHGRCVAYVAALITECWYTLLTREYQQHVAGVYVCACVSTGVKLINYTDSLDMRALEAGVHVSTEVWAHSNRNVHEAECSPYYVRSLVYTRMMVVKRGC
jgi:hypothetical protein